MWPVAPEEGAVVGGGGALTDLSGRHPIIIRQRTNYQADTQLSGRHPTVRQTPNCEADTPLPMHSVPASWNNVPGFWNIVLESWATLF